jgi:multiple sugar transport system ATP-binding protein
MADLELIDLSKSFAGQPQPVIDWLNLRAGSGELIALLGPSGCGKTTVLRLIAGLDYPSSGDILIEGRSVLDLDPSKRDIAMVFQQYALYPHLTVGENIGYPLKALRLSRQEREARIVQTAELVGASGLLDRKPGELSGGEQQRVALGRAIIRRPRIFLMDEPLSNLDAALRLQMRTTLKALQKELGITTIMVTHDQGEAMSMADRIAVMNAGVIQQIGSPDEIYDNPANLFVAGFVGSPPMNLIPAERAGDSIMLAGSWRHDIHRPVPNGTIVAGIRPEGIQLSQGAQPGAHEAPVFISEPLGSETIVSVGCEGIAIRVRVAPEVRPASGERVYLRIRPGYLRLFDGATGQAIDRDQLQP